MGGGGWLTWVTFNNINYARIKTKKAINMTKPFQNDKESDIKALNALIKEAGAKAKSLKNEAMKIHLQKLSEIVSGKNQNKLAS